MTHHHHRRRVLDFEDKRQPLISQSDFIRRLILVAGLAILLLVIWTVLGMAGYHWLAGLRWVDAFMNASMIVGGMGPVDLLTSDAAKLFAGAYAILSGVVFLGVFGLLLAPIFHRFLHRFHMEEEEAALSKSDH